MTDAVLEEDPTLMALLKGYRVRADLTQEQLAEGAGVSVRAISDMERGIVKGPQRRTVEALAAPLALSEDELARLQKVAKQSRARSTSTEQPPRPAVRLYDPPAVGMLPPDLEDLTGREHCLETLRALADEMTSNRGGSGQVAVVSGPPGTGKTSLAVRAAHDLAEHFPDGRLFLKLRGMSAEPGEPADVLHLLLRLLGIDAVQIPVELEHRSNLCRSLLRDRAVLIVLDDAVDEAQVRPLVVGGPRCFTVVTSRQLLVGLEGTSRFTLSELQRDDALALLTSIIGPVRVTREPQAAAELVELCGRLPLALRIAGNRLASRPAWPLDHLAGHLRDRSRRLTTLTAGDLNVRSVFDLSYRQLTSAAAAVFRRVALVPAADFSVGAAKVLIEATDEDDAAICLEELADASLLQPSQEDGRYQLHDLLSVFATERLTQEEDPEVVRRADERLTRWLLLGATAAGGHFHPCCDPISPLSASLFEDAVSAGRWLLTEHQSWLAAVKRSAARGEHQQVLDLAASMHWYSEIGGTANTWHDVFDLAVKSAIAIGSKRDEAVHRNYLAWTLCSLMGRPNESARMAQKAWDAAEAAGDLREQAWARIYFVSAQLNDGKPPASSATFDEAIRLFSEADYPLGVHVARAMRATYLHTQGQLEDAAEEFGICLRYFRQAQGSTSVDDSSCAYLLLRSAQNLAALGSREEALSQSEEALELFQAHGAVIGQARALQAAGSLLRMRGDHVDARARLTEALALFERTGQAQYHVDALRELALLSDEAGDPVAARSAREKALSLCEMLDAGAAKSLREELIEQLNAS
ncbi:ATP-binding protein [Lentzea albidocapillata]|uniref:Helix-turn-helix domain-containing protein n=1 Tax=Lentzea albidocapillata TaxID=40571 RepID=A0A1W2DFZ0_9PSEU|nr:NB-ARC domain-containing protein [Lentzea albidocapillata]SMC96431.1 Helix-turn-helix domain-containing protein [Lentzea albidocapillata]